MNVALQKLGSLIIIHQKFNSFNEGINVFNTTILKLWCIIIIIFELFNYDLMGYL
jgi:hypothetical protein